MKILVISAYWLYNDLTLSFVHAQAKAYAAAGQEVRAVIPLPMGSKRLPKEAVRLSNLLYRLDDGGVAIYYLIAPSLSNFGNRRFGSRCLNAHGAIAVLRSQLPLLTKDFQPDVIQAHAFGTASEVGIWLKKKLHCPLVVTTHGSDTSVTFDTGRRADLERWAKGVDRIVAVTSTLSKRLAKCDISTPVCVIHNGFRIENLSESQARDPGRIIQVGRLNFQKRVCRTIEAFARLREAHSDMTLTLVGKGPDEAQLRAQCEELGVSDVVDFKGQLPNAQVFQELAASRFFCMPSVREGFGIVYLEAMANGCITIGTEGEGISECIVHGKNGFLVPPDDVDAIVNVVEWCLAHPAEATAIAEQGRTDALAMTWEHNATQYLELFASLTS